MSYVEDCSECGACTNYHVCQECWDKAIAEAKREGIAEGRKLGRQEERNDVVAWLRSKPSPKMSEAYRIERAEHVAAEAEEVK